MANMRNVSEEWYQSLHSWHLDMFFIPTTLLTVVTLLVNPALLACILLSHTLRQETRYLLVANTLAADILFLLLNLGTVVCNALSVEMRRLLCELVSAATVTAYCCAILTVTLMVADTYVAVRWPLHYHDLLPLGRARHILAGVWVGAAMYPLSQVILMEAMVDGERQSPALCLVLISMGTMGGDTMVGVHLYFATGFFLCTFLILYCYIRLYMVTKTQGIWQNRYSRARVTLLAHGLLLLLYFGPGLVFTMELFLLRSERVSLDVRVWINTVNMCVLTLLPRACAPFLYGLRYREISDTVLHLLPSCCRPTQVNAA